MNARSSAVAVRPCSAWAAIDAQQTVDIPGHDGIVGEAVEFRRVVDDALVAVDDLELDQRCPLPATPPIDRREHPMDLRIRGRQGQGVETRVRGRAHVARARERSGPGDETVDVAAGAGDRDLLRDQTQLVADRARASVPGAGPPASAICGSPSGSSASHAPRNAFEWPDPSAAR